MATTRVFTFRVAQCNYVLTRLHVIHYTDSDVCDPSFHIDQIAFTGVELCGPSFSTVVLNVDCPSFRIPYASGN
jgi:hypothetical protein